jgi:integrase
LPTRKLTDLFAERVKPPERGRLEYFDASFGGLALRVTAKGRKSWSLHYRIDGRLRRYTLGNFPAIKPAQARREASDILDRVRAGIDPTVEKRERRYARPPEADTFGAVVEDYLAKHLAKNAVTTTYIEARRILEKDALPRWRDRPIASITRRDVLELIDAIGARGAEIGANRMLARLRALWNWAIEKDRAPQSPLSRMKAPTKERPRDRVLSDDELRWLWGACGLVGAPFGPLIKLLVLTGQRRDEVASLEWSEFDLKRRLWTMPREKAKNNRAHEIHLSDAAMEVLQSIPRLDAALVFTTTGTRPVSGFSKARGRIDAAMIKARRRSLGLPEDLRVEIEPWTLHDLRRTAATGMARLNIPPHVVDKVLNHVSGTIRGVAAVYNRFEYLDERRAALAAWRRYVKNLVAPAPVNVVSLRGG